MMTILKKIAKLIDVKSIVTFILTAVFAFLSVKGTVSGQEFLSVFIMIISFYFGTQAGKKEEKEDKEENT